MKALLATIAASAAAIAAGCSDGGPVVDIDHTHEPTTQSRLVSNRARTPDAEFVTRTIVRINPDGSIDSKSFQISRERQQADVLARLAALRGRASKVEGHGGPPEVTADIHTDSSCSSGDLMLFDNTDCDTFGNTLCVVGSGTLDLSTICDGFLCANEWNDSVLSYMKGSESGYLYDTTAFNGETLTGGGACENTGVYGQNANQVVLSN